MLYVGAVLLAKINRFEQFRHLNPFLGGVASASPAVFIQERVFLP